MLGILAHRDLCGASLILKVGTGFVVGDCPLAGGWFAALRLPEWDHVARPVKLAA